MAMPPARAWGQMHWDIGSVTYSVLGCEVLGGGQQ